MLIEFLHMHSVYLGLNAHWIDAHAESLPGRTYMRIELIRMRSVYLVIHICALNWCAWVVFTWASRRIKLMRMRSVDLGVNEHWIDAHAQCLPGRTVSLLEEALHVECGARIQEQLFTPGWPTCYWAICTTRAESGSQGSSFLPLTTRRSKSATLLWEIPVILVLYRYRCNFYTVEPFVSAVSSKKPFYHRYNPF